MKKPLRKPLITVLIILLVIALIIVGIVYYSIVDAFKNWSHQSQLVYSYHKNGFHTNTVEGFFSILKRGIYGIYHSVSPWHLQRYCDEFASRYNSRKITDDERFELSIKNSDGRLKYNQFIGKIKQGAFAPYF